MLKMHRLNYHNGSSDLFLEGVSLLDFFLDPKPESISKPLHSQDTIKT